MTPGRPVLGVTSPRREGGRVSRRDDARPPRPLPTAWDRQVTIAKASAAGAVALARARRAVAEIDPAAATAEEARRDAQRVTACYLARLGDLSAFHVAAADAAADESAKRLRDVLDGFEEVSNA